jgi:hypothetical protein
MILDKNGSNAEVKKTKLFTVLEKNISQLIDTKISGSGTVTDFKSNIGRIGQTKESGGTIAVFTQLDIPLVINEEYEHELSYYGNKCFESKSETITYIFVDKLEEFGITVKFPLDRPPTLVTAKCEQNSTIIDLTKNHITIENNVIRFKLKRPTIGSTITVEWNW